MKKIYIESFEKIAHEMHDKITNKAYSDVSFIGLYDDCIELIDDLLVFGGVCLHYIQIEPEEWDGYDREFLVTIDRELNIWCEKAYREQSGYFRFISDCLLIANDCNKEVFDHVESDEVWEVSYGCADDECLDDECLIDGCCGKCCCFGGCTEDTEDNTELNEQPSEYASEYHNISRTKDGKVAGFTKSWSTEKNGITSYSSFSYMGNDESAVRKLAEDFGIKID